MDELVPLLLDSYHFLKPYILIVIVASTVLWLGVILTHRVKPKKTPSARGSSDPEKRPQPNAPKPGDRPFGGAPSPSHPAYQL